MSSMSAEHHNLMLRSYDLGLPLLPSVDLGHKLRLIEARNTSTEPITWAVGLPCPIFAMALQNHGGIIGLSAA
jgi:hypothetical protein